jgi:hypothetical protein
MPSFDFVTPAVIDICPPLSQKINTVKTDGTRRPHIRQSTKTAWRLHFWAVVFGQLYLDYAKTGFFLTAGKDPSQAKLLLTNLGGSEEVS